MLHGVIGVVLLPLRVVLAAFGARPWASVIDPFRRVAAMLASTPTTLLLCSTLLIAFVVQVLVSDSLVAAFVMEESDLVSGAAHTVVTSSFLHAGLYHLVSNVVALFVFGRVVEQYFDGVTLLVTYAAGVVVGGSLTQLVQFSRGSEWGAVGASIGVAAVMALAVLRSPFSFTYVTVLPLPVAFVGVLYALQEVSKLFVADGVSHLGHGLGLAVGVALAALTGGFRRFVLRAGLVVLAVVVGFAVLLGLSLV